MRARRSSSVIGWTPSSIGRSFLIASVTSCALASPAAATAMNVLRFIYKTLLITYKTLLIVPPSACSVAPVMYDAASENRNTAAFANSFGSP